MAWPVPRELLLSAPQLTWDWDGDNKEGGGGEKKIREYLNAFRVTDGRVVLMAKAEEHAKVAPGATWEKEPWYGSEYRVERFNEEFIKQVRNDASRVVTDPYSPPPLRLKALMISLRCSCPDLTSSFQ